MGHHSWTSICPCVPTYQDILAYNCEDGGGAELPFPIIADSKRELAEALGMLDPDERDGAGLPLTARCASVPTKLLLLGFFFRMSTPVKGVRNPSLPPLLRSGVHHRSRQEAEAVSALPRHHRTQL